MTGALGATTRLHGRELRRIAAALGHREQAVWEAPNGRYFASCSCGWTSTQTATLVAATSSLVHHVVNVAEPVWERARRNGQDVRDLVDQRNASPQRPARSAQKPGWEERSRRVA